MVEVSENLIACGKSAFIRQVVVPVGEQVEKIANEHPCTQDLEIKLQGRPQACGTGLEALIGICVFLGGWGVKKFLDEIYELKYAPIVREKLAKYMEAAGEDKKYSLSISVRKKNKSSSVLICCVGSDIEEIQASEVHIPTVLDLSDKYIDSSEENQVFLFVIDNGSCNLSPAVYGSYDEAIAGLKGLYPLVPPKYIRDRVS
ncbi:MAG: hypothetical protein OIF51_01555 [Cellvibrionaceae bacterium]|nr:hypothetical protein [Cellvibrionaceae bacterium]